MADAAPPEKEGRAAAPPPATGTRSIARRDFEQVIRRAAELTLSDADPNEQLTEDEVVRIAAELGLSTQHVKRALAELPELNVRQRWYDEYFGSPVVTASRPVPGQAPTTMRRIEDYLVTREYLQIVRRRGTSLAFVPADDTISSVARAFTRSANRHFVSRATRVVVGVEPMPDQTSHVRFEMDLSEARQSAVKTGMTLGIMGGLLTGSVAAALLAPGVAPLPEVLGVAPSVIAFLGGLGGTTAASFSVAARRFRERAAAARLELNGMLDRLEHGERLEPPPAPWRRKLFGER